MNMRPLADVTPEQDREELIELAHEIKHRAKRAIREFEEGNAIMAKGHLEMIMNDIKRIEFLSAVAFPKRGAAA